MEANKGVTRKYLDASASSKRVKLDEGKVHESESGNIDSHDMESTIHGLGAKVRANPAVRLSDEEKNEETKALEGAAAAARTALVLEDDLLLESGFSSFPAKLMSLLDGCEVQDSMWWLPDGDAFCLVPSTFDATLEKHFQGTKFESFTRKLNRWGFKRVAGQKVPPDTIAYYHKEFQRGKRELLKDVNGSKNRIHASRDYVMQSPSHIPVERKKAANVSSFVHSAQHLPDEFVTERGIAGQERGLESFLERRQEAALIELPLLAQQGEAFINSEFQMRLTRNSGYESLSTDDQTRLASSLLLANSYPSSEIDPSEILSRTALTRVSHQDQLSRSILTGHSPQDRFVQQIWARDLASSMTATVPRVGVLDQMDALSNLRARILAQSLGEAARTQQVESVARLGSHLSTDVAYFSPSRMLNQPAIEAISSRAADPAFDLSLSLMAQHDESRSVPLLSSRSRSANPFDSAQLGASVSGDHSEPSQTEQLLQLYLLQQQQRRQQDRPP